MYKKHNTPILQEYCNYPAILQELSIYNIEVHCGMNKEAAGLL